MEGNKRAGSYDVAQSSLCYFTSSESFYRSFDRKESLNLTPIPCVRPNHVGEDYNSHEATLRSLTPLP